MPAVCPWCVAAERWLDTRSGWLACVERGIGSELCWMPLVTPGGFSIEIEVFWAVLKAILGVLEGF